MKEKKEGRISLYTNNIKILYHLMLITQQLDEEAAENVPAFARGIKLIYLLSSHQIKGKFIYMGSLILFFLNNFLLVFGVWPLAAARGLSLVVVHGFIAVASLVAQHGL